MTYLSRADLSFAALGALYGAFNADKFCRKSGPKNYFDSRTIFLLLSGAALGGMVFLGARFGTYKFIARVFPQASTKPFRLVRTVASIALQTFIGHVALSVAVPELNKLANLVPVWRA